MLPTARVKRLKILVVRYRFIGDTILAVPFLKALRALYPDAQIDMLVGPQSGEILAHCPYIDRLLFYDTTRKHRYENQTHVAEPRSFWSYVSELKEEGYQKAYVLKRSFSSALLVKLANIPERIGFDTEWRGWLLTKSVPYRKDGHESDCFLDLLRAETSASAELTRVLAFSPEHFGFRMQDWPGFEGVPEVSTAEVSPLEPVSSQQNLRVKHVALHLSSSNAGKEWPEEKAVSLARDLLHTYPLVLHFLGAASDRLRYERLVSRLLEDLPQSVIHRTWFYNWCGQTTLQQSLRVLARMDLVVGVDSGTMHMAAAVGTPTVVLFGPMDERKWRPLGPHVQVLVADTACHPCNLKTPCRHQYQCMTDLSIETVTRACQTILNP